MAETSKNIIIQQPHVSEEFILPFHGLMLLLRQNGFSIKPDDYIEILKIVEKFGSNDVKNIGPLICPLIAISPEEQAKFYKVFDQYIQTVQEPPPPPPPPPPFTKWLIAGAITVLLLLAYFTFVRVDRPGLSAYFFLADQAQFRLGDTIELDASKMDFYTLSDTNKVKLLWNFNGNWNEGPLKQRIVLNQQGPFIIQLKITSDDLLIKDSVKIDSFYVCPAAPLILFSKPEATEYFVGDSIVIPASFADKKLPFDYVFWQVNSDTVDNNRLVLRYKFLTEGQYSINFKGVLNDQNTQCATATYLNDYLVTVKNKNQKNYSLAVTPTQSYVAPKQDVRLKSILNWILVIPALLLLLATYLTWKKTKRQLSDKQKIAPLTFGGKKPPYDTPFENRELELVSKEHSMNEVFRSFRQKAEEEVPVLNVAKTIRSTIQAGGFPEFVFSNRLRYSDYLIITDESIVNNQQTRLFNYLINILNEEAINIDKFYYKESIEQLYNEQYSDGISLQRVAELYKQSTLIVFGNAWQLVYQAYPMLEKKITDTLNEWEFKAILTPIGYKDWGEKEQLIRQQFILLPADIKGQVKLIQAIREQQLNHQKYLAGIDEFVETQSFDLEVVEDIEGYLSDKVLFQWICAVSVFHKLRWEIVIEMGKAICSSYGHYEKMNYTSLLKFARISWMQEGVFPGVTRMELLRKLMAENEVVARTTLLRMLEYSDTFFGKEYFFEEEKEIQKITSRFVLFAHDPLTFKQFEPEEERFRALWKNDQIRDTPQRAYLDKQPGDNYSTLIQQNGETVGAGDFLASKDGDGLKHFKKVAWRNGLIALALLLVLACLHFFKDKLPANNYFNTSTTLNANISILLDDIVYCENPSSNVEEIKTVTGNLNVGGTDFPLIFSKTTNNRLESSNTITHTSEPDSTGLLTINWNNGKSDQTLSKTIVLSAISQAVINACENNKLPPLHVYYNDKIAYAAVENQLKAALNNFEILSSEKSFTTPSYIRYDDTGQENKSDSIKNILWNTLGIYTNTEISPYRDTTIDIYLNLNALKFRTITVANLPTSLNEIWHGGTSNRLINIDLPNKIIYYSTGDKKTFGTYKIDEIYVNNGTYKMITIADKSYQVFILKNIQTSSFNLSVCQNRYTSIAEAQTIDESYCDKFNRMTWYYETDANKIWVPQNAKSYTAAERRKAADILNALIKSNGSGQASINVNSLTESGIGNRSVEDRRSIIKANNVLTSDKISYFVSRGNSVFNGTPFDRDYISYMAKEVPVRQETNEPATTGADYSPVKKEADCSRVFTSMKEALSVDPLVICKMDLSKQGLTAVPKDLFSFKNLQELDLRENQIPEEEINQLKQTFPKANIQFTPLVSSVVSTSQLLARVTLGSNNYYPDTAGLRLLSQIFSYLEKTPASAVQIISYTDKAGIKNIQQVQNALRGYIEKQFGSFTVARLSFTYRQITPQKNEPSKSPNSRPGRVTTLPAAVGTYVDVYGTGFPKDFSVTLVR